jgi:hypothetical protein
LYSFTDALHTDNPGNFFGHLIQYKKKADEIDVPIPKKES